MPQPFNIQQMLKQAQEMQEQMMEESRKAQEALKQERVDASAGGGMVKVVASGDGKLISIEIDPDAVDPDDVELLQDMVLAAVNEALRAADELAQRVMAQSADVDPASALEALGLGGGLGGLGGLGGGELPGGLPGGAPPNRAARRKKR